MSGINNSDDAARSAALDVLRHAGAAPEPTEEELLAGTPLRAVPELAVRPLDAPEAAPARHEATEAGPATSSETKTRPRRGAKDVDLPVEDAELDADASAPTW